MIRSPPQNKDLQTYLNLFVLNTAYAANQKVCFFAGWPSTYENGVCRNPQNLNAQPHIQNIDKYAPDDACTGSKQFRCNPALFGEPSIFDRRQSNDTKEIEVFWYIWIMPQIDYLLERGDFVSIRMALLRTYLKSARKYLIVILRACTLLLRQPGKLSSFSQAVAEFCGQHDKYDACDDLNKRLEMPNQK